MNLWASQQRKEFLREKRGVIEGHLKLARAGARSDSFLRIHLLKSETDLDLLENDLLAADQDIREKEAAAAEFLNTDPAEFHPILEEPGLPAISSPSS
ncbi:MAG: hypothetical protein K5Q00_01825, partial [Gammaproteobacteria bacterium]|nr:hypothetical protein [Gammaproteobacteria bacterium]